MDFVCSKLHVHVYRLWAFSSRAEFSFRVLCGASQCSAACDAAPLREALQTEGWCIANGCLKEGLRASEQLQDLPKLQVHARIPPPFKGVLMSYLTESVKRRGLQRAFRIEECRQTAWAPKTTAQRPLSIQDPSRLSQTSAFVHIRAWSAGRTAWWTK